MKASMMKATPRAENCWCKAEPYFRVDNARLGIYAISCLNPECDNHRVALGRGAVDTAELWNAMMADHAELARLRAELEQARGALFSAKNTIKEERNDAAAARGATSEARAELARLRAALAAAEAERDEARHEVEVRDSIYAQAAKTFVKHASDQIEIDRLRGEVDKHVLKSEKRRLRIIELEAREYRQRRTIRALVVAGRGMYYALVRALVGWGMEPSDAPTKQATMRIKYSIMRTRQAGKE